MENSNVSVEKLIEQFRPLPNSEVEKIAREKIKSVKIVSELPDDKKFEIVMGEIMEKIRGKAAGKDVARLVRKYF
ncbi:MAG: GatB/YqeY domain-containing protein [Calditrichaeota bacterium]|nr:GatB/YqeY domain-containing protein [Calditrichota bacterium]